MDLNLQFGIDSSAFALPTLPLDSVDDIFYGVTASPNGLNSMFYLTFLKMCSFDVIVI